MLGHYRMPMHPLPSPCQRRHLRPRLGAPLEVGHDVVESAFLDRVDSVSGYGTHRRTAPRVDDLFPIFQCFFDCEAFDVGWKDHKRNTGEAISARAHCKA